MTGKEVYVYNTVVFGRKLRKVCDVMGLQRIMQCQLLIEERICNGAIYRRA